MDEAKIAGALMVIDEASKDPLVDWPSLISALMQLMKNAHDTLEGTGNG